MAKFHPRGAKIKPKFISHLPISLALLALPSLSISIHSAAADELPSSCQELTRESAASLRTDRSKSSTQITKLGICLRSLAATAYQADQALIRYRTFRADSTTGRVEVPRVIYTDSELSNLRGLTDARHFAYKQLENKISDALRDRSGLLEVAAEIDRYAVLKAVLEHRHDSLGDATSQAIASATGNRFGFAMESSERNQPTRLLHPYALISIIPNPGDESRPLVIGHENPFTSTKEKLKELEGPEQWVSDNIRAYRTIRATDNPHLPSRASSTTAPIRVAIMDSGIDFVKHARFSEMLPRGERGETFSLDEADLESDRANPWAPDIGQLGHGTWTVDGFYSVLTSRSANLIDQRRLSLGVWKINSIRSVLSGAPYEDLDRFDTRIVSSIARSLKEATRRPLEQQPQIVSVSLAMTSYELLRRNHDEGVVRQSPWLWIMAAGNAGANLRDFPTACFGDFPAELRPIARLLCVGAIHRGPLGDTVANYSNYGAGVDLYTYEDSSQLCTIGTSCAAPAIAAAAAAVLGAYPGLSPEALRSVLLAASEEKRLSVQTDSGMDRIFDLLGQAPEARTIRFFDPLKHLERALEIANSF